MCYYSFSNNLKKKVLSYILDMYSPKIFRGLKIGGEKNKCYVLYFRKFFIDSSTRLHKSSRHWTWVSIKLPATNHQSFNIFTQNAHSPPFLSLSIRQGIFLSWQMLEKIDTSRRKVSSTRQLNVWNSPGSSLTLSQV